MTDSDNNVPKLRFPGFDDAWEQRKLKDIADFSKGNGYSKSDLVEDGYPVILYGRLYTKYETVIESVDTFAELKEKSVISKGNEVIVPASGESAEDIARASVVEFAGIILGSDLNIVRTNNELDPTFLALTISNGSQQRKMSKRAQGKSVVHLHNSDLKEINLLVPKIEEQKGIRSLFKQLDNLITLHQRKLSDVKKLKSGLLQKMFPKNGENIPEIRFLEFTNAWEQRKLKDIADFSKGNGYSKSDLVEDGYPVILYGRLYTKYETVIESVDTFAELKEKSVISKGNEVIVPASGESAEDIARASVVEFAGIILGSDLNIVRTNNELDPTFLALTISNGSQQRKMSKRAQGKSVVHLHNSDLKEINLLVPKIEEQKGIRSLFKQLDNLITLHQRKLEHLQQQKKALLQQMFI
ncbi:restriction endonuclease subunit S [Leuconostoc sp. MS02]|uniref:Restriction endonuclease subunit S n=1 Tax=Leuconostoc aquikimchii TaxID=3236804 RepID=A0ABV3S7A2_9LACO